jgi:hypothetical protein
MGHGGEEARLEPVDFLESADGALQAIQGNDMGCRSATAKPSSMQQDLEHTRDMRCDGLAMTAGIARPDHDGTETLPVVDKRVKGKVGAIEGFRVRRHASKRQEGASTIRHRHAGSMNVGETAHENADIPCGDQVAQLDWVIEERDVGHGKS